jgi:hypothetical protein
MESATSKLRPRSELGDRQLDRDGVVVRVAVRLIREADLREPRTTILPILISADRR